VKMEDLLELAERACEIAKALGADQADAYVSALRSISVGVENNSIASCRSIEDNGMSIRAYRKGGLGFAYTQRLTPDAVRELAERAVGLAGAAEPDPDFVSLPEPNGEVAVAGLWDDAAAETTVDEVTGWAMDAVEEARALEPEITVSGGAGAHVGHHAIANSLGIRREHAGTLVSVSVQGSIREGDEAGTYWEFARARQLSELRRGGIGEVAARGARQFRNPARRARPARREHNPGLDRHAGQRRVRPAEAITSGREKR
jgi:PmbA protein